MARRKIEKSQIGEDDFAERVATQAKRFKDKFADYQHFCLTLSAFDAGLNYHFNVTDGRSMLVERDRFPNVDGSTPDMVCIFASGYGLVWELKKLFNVDAGAQERTIRQLASYKGLNLGARYPDCTSHDVLLLVGHGSDESAVESIAADSRLGAGSIIVVEYVYQGQRHSGEVIEVAHRSFQGSNGRFRDDNSAPTGDELNLNECFFKSSSKAWPCDETTIRESGECPFINDEPPPIYTFITVVVPCIAQLMGDDLRDELATEGKAIVHFSFQALINTAKELFPRVPEDKFRSWLNTCINEVARARIVDVVKKSIGLFAIKLTHDLKKVDLNSVAMRLARRTIEESYVISRDRGQLSFDID